MRTFLVTLLIAASGCSIALQDKPARGPAKSASGCSETNLYWIADSVGVAAATAAITTAIVRQDKASDGEVAAYAAAGFAGVLYLASMGNGIRWSRECRALQSEAVPAVASE